MEFIVYLTNRCNLCCEMCTQYGENFKENSPREMSIDEWDKFFRSIADVYPKPKIILIGGEPFLYKDFDILFEKLQKYGFFVHIVTNGTLLDKHLDVLFNAETAITISLDGLGDVHDKIRGKQGTFNKVIENIKKANKLQKAGAKFKLLINSVILPDNVDKMADFVSYIQQFNIEQIVFQHLQFSSEEYNYKTNIEWQKKLGCEFKNNFITKKVYNINEDYIEKIKKSMKILEKVCQVETFVFPYLTDSEMTKYYLEKNLDEIRPYLTCTTPWLYAFVGPDGYVSNCIENTIGNIKENDFWELWNNEKANKIRQVLCENGSFDFCKKCCNFYKENFLLAKNGKIRLNDKVLSLPSELNYLKPSPDGVFVLDKSRIPDNGEIPVYPMEIFSSRTKELIEKNETIIGYFKEIKGEKYEGSNSNSN